MGCCRGEATRPLFAVPRRVQWCPCSSGIANTSSCLLDFLEMMWLLQEQAEGGVGRACLGTHPCVLRWQQVQLGPVPEARSSPHFTLHMVPIRACVSFSGLPSQVTTNCGFSPQNAFSSSWGRLSLPAPVPRRCGPGCWPEFRPTSFIPRDSFVF